MRLAPAIGLATVFTVSLRACGGGPTPPASTTAASPAAPTPSGAGPCDVVAGGPAGPVTDPNGPFFHSVAIGSTTDGVRITDPLTVLEHASVPDGVARTGGEVLVYYVNGAAGYVWVGRTDGTALTPIAPVALNGIATPAGIVDPDATRLPDGRIRLAYLGGFGPPGGTTSRAMCLADSSDGLSFSVVGAAYDIPAGDTLTDPSLARLQDGSWLMAMSRGQQTVMARSPDGLRFASYATLTFGGVPEITALPDGRVRLYVCAGGIESYISANSGQSWTREAIVIAPGTLGARIICDPSYVPDAQMFVFKIAQ